MDNSLEQVVFIAYQSNLVRVTHVSQARSTTSIEWNRDQTNLAALGREVEDGIISFSISGRE